MLYGLAQFIPDIFFKYTDIIKKSDIINNIS